MDNHEYWKEVNGIAANLVSESMGDNDNDRDAAEEEINDTRLHETIDGHQWVIYYSYNLDVIKHSDNEDYYNDNFEITSKLTDQSTTFESGSIKAIQEYLVHPDLIKRLRLGEGIVVSKQTFTTALVAFRADSLK